MTWLLVAMFAIPVLLNRKDFNKFLTAISFMVVYILNAGNTFEGANLIYCNMLLSASLLIAPSLLSSRDWSSILCLIIFTFICSDFLAIINFHSMQLQVIADGIDMFKYSATTAVLAVLVIMRDGKLDRYTVHDKRVRLQHFTRDLFNLSNNCTRLQGYK